MAIIRFGPTVVGIRGTTGGVTFSANRAGPYIKPWQRGPKVRSASQASRGNVMTNMAGEWRNITQAQRDAWDTWAAGSAPARFNSLGEPLNLSGFAWFVEMNSQLTYYGAAIRSAAPTLAEPAAPTISSFTVLESGTGDSVLGYPNNTFLNDFRRFAFAQSNSQAANSFARAQYFVFNRGMVGGSASTVQSNLEQRWGLIQLGRRWFVQMARVNAEGLAGPSALALADTT